MKITIFQYIVKIVHILLKIHKLLILIINQTMDGILAQVKKIAIVLGIVVIALLLFSFIYNSTQPDNKSSLNVISADEKVQEGSNYPYQAHIMYNGTWSGKVGDPNYIREVSGHGDESYNLDCAPWDKVNIVIEKSDGSSNELKVELLKNGNVVAENSTTSSTGSVVINYNY